MTSHLAWQGIRPRTSLPQMRSDNLALRRPGPDAHPARSADEPLRTICSPLSISLALALALALVTSRPSHQSSRLRSLAGHQTLRALEDP